jgi:hypothetical protein
MKNDGLIIQRFTPNEVVAGLKSLSSTSGVGEVGIESRLFIECAEELGPVITDLYNLIISTHTFPNEWKCAHVTPIFKGKGLKTALDNYRPVSILSPISKLFETLLSQQISSFLESNKMLHPAQFGFRKKFSCELALTCMLDNWRDNLDRNNDIVAVFLDLSKAFDTVDHKLLLSKLPFYNFDPNLILLIDNYLSNRNIKVNINGTLSSSQPLLMGVPQGSVLGPLLFILFINDICFLDLHSKLCLYADDSTISSSGKTTASIITNIESDLILILDWLKHNKLIINVKKTQAMYINSNLKLRKTIQTDQSKLTINCNNTSIPFSSEVKLLGVIIDNKLSFTSQTNNICKKVNSKTHLLSKSLYLFTDQFKPTLFKLFIQSQFDYCSTLLIHHSNKSNKDRFSTCFCKSIKRILNINIFTNNCEDQYHKLHKFKILPLSFRHFFRFCTFLFNTLKNNNTEICISINNNISTSVTRQRYSELPFKKTFNKYSFTAISLKLRYNSNWV